jgi:hypothetical protein
MTTASGPLTYRLLTGPDDATFCARVSRALAEGYCLYGSPALAFDGQRIIAAQAVVLPDTGGLDNPTATGMDPTSGHQG